MDADKLYLKIYRNKFPPTTWNLAHVNAIKYFIIVAENVPLYIMHQHVFRKVSIYELFASFLERFPDWNSSS